MREIKSVTVVGANGTMGTLVSAIFASFGDARVYMVSRSMEKSEAAVEKALQSVRAASIRPNLHPADYSSLEDCVAASDFVFETVQEQEETKREINARIAKVLPPHAVLASGTSGLNLTRLAEDLPEDLRRRYMGTHFFNPPYALRLCEFIPTQHTDTAVAAEIKEYLERKLLRAVVVLQDQTAFLGNRIGFMFLNRAMQLAEELQAEGGIDYIDALFGPFTGRGMAPLVTSDFVGLDIHKAIVDNVYQNGSDPLPQRFVFPPYGEKLVAEGKLGRKTKTGLYRSEVKADGRKRQQVYDIRRADYRDVNTYGFPFVDEMNRYIREGEYRKAYRGLIEDPSAEARLCLSLLMEYILYSIYAGQQVGSDVRDADVVMGEGFGWCPPLALRDLLREITDFDALARERVAPDFQVAFDVEGLLAAAKPSVYDYRPFIKAGRKG